jgi:hypothetical protein
VNKLQEWRLKYEQNIERKLRKSNLENASHWMIEFQYQKFDDVEIPGQYLKVRFYVDRIFMNGLLITFHQKKIL